MLLIVDRNRSEEHLKCTALSHLCKILLVPKHLLTLLLINHLWCWRFMKHLLGLVFSPSPCIRSSVSRLLPPLLVHDMHESCVEGHQNAPQGAMCVPKCVIEHFEFPTMLVPTLQCGIGKTASERLSERGAKSQVCQSDFLFWPRYVFSMIEWCFQWKLCPTLNFTIGCSTQN